MTEAEFQTQVVSLARICGWRCLHVRRSIGKGNKWVTTTSIKGWPDLFLFHPKRGVVFAAELKTDTGKLTYEQGQVIADLIDSGIPAVIWRPDDWDEIQAVLTGSAPQATEEVDDLRTERPHDDPEEGDEHAGESDEDGGTDHVGHATHATRLSRAPAVPSLHDSVNVGLL